MNSSIPWPPGVRFGDPLMQQHDFMLFANTMGQLRTASAVVASPVVSSVASPIALPTSGKGLPTARKQKSLKTAKPASDGTTDDTGHGKGIRRSRSSRKSLAAEATFSGQQDRTQTLFRLSPPHYLAGSSGYLPKAMPLHHAPPLTKFVSCRRLI